MFNNLLVNTCNGMTGGCGVALWWTGPGTTGGGSIYNNTIDGGGEMACYSGYTTIANILKNNICLNGIAVAEIGPNDWTQLVSNYNDGYPAPSNWACVNVEVSGSCLTLASYKSMEMQEANSITSNPALTVSYQLTIGSPAIGAGINLTSLGIPALDLDCVGAARPSTGAWTIGAYNYIPPPGSISSSTGIASSSGVQ